jgi:hypothetical protein
MQNCGLACEPQLRCGPLAIQILLFFLSVAIPFLAKIYWGTYN